MRHSLLPRWGEGEDEGEISTQNTAPHPNPLPIRGEGVYNIGEILRNITKSLTNYSDAPHIDAQRIILHVLKQREPSYLLAHATDVLTAPQLQEITSMVTQRKTGMPLAYILGEADFYGRTFIVTPDVLIPRPDTETLIEKALEYVKKNFENKKEVTIADICTGSGIIAITLALELVRLTKALPAVLAGISYKLVATDTSPAALRIAKLNAEKHGVADKIEFIEGDMLNPIKNQHVDLIVSNPPYIPTAELAQLSLRGAESDEAISTYHAARLLRSARNDSSLETRGLMFEPRIALDGGPDGQLFVDQIKASGIPAIIETTGGEIITHTHSPI